MAKNTIEFEWFWIYEDSDGSCCEICEDVICGRMYLPVISSGSAENTKFSELNFKVCSSCYDLIQEIKKEDQ